MSDSSYAGLSACNVILYTRRGCHLCEEVLLMLQRHGISPDCIDIDNDPTLRNKYDACVPVVEINGRVRFRGTVHPLLLRRILRAENVHTG
jgi:glutaredoxin